MKAKDSKKSSPERFRGIMLQTGFVITLSLVLIAFEWTSPEKRDAGVAYRSGTLVAEDLIPITEQKDVKVMPSPRITTLFRVVDDNREVRDSVMVDAEVNDDTRNADTLLISDITFREDTVAEPDRFRVVEDMPEFPGGMTALSHYLVNNIRYPAVAREAGISGKVYLEFTVSREGTISDISVLRGIGGGCDEEAVRVVRAMPPWVPGKQRGKPVNVRFTLPVTFTLLSH
jgi:protein TonB